MCGVGIWGVEKEVSGRLGGGGKLGGFFLFKPARGGVFFLKNFLPRRGLFFGGGYNLINLLVNEWRYDNERLQIADKIRKDTIL